jgi:hypothetical protein
MLDFICDLQLLLPLCICDLQLILPLCICDLQLLLLLCIMVVVSWGKKSYDISHN